MLDIDECLMLLFYVVKRGEVYCAGPVSPTRNGNFANVKRLVWKLIKKIKPVFLMRCMICRNRLE